MLYVHLFIIHTCYPKLKLHKRHLKRLRDFALLIGCTLTLGTNFTEMYHNTINFTKIEVLQVKDRNTSMNFVFNYKVLNHCLLCPVFLFWLGKVLEKMIYWPKSLFLALYTIQIIFKLKQFTKWLMSRFQVLLWIAIPIIFKNPL